ncbi:hypothetical protein [Kibdelosporangium philippinense]|uniref:hypothetical protein n=1 Tax=Kibdelosporangium philippinense TaxID=211113 RepID=UPI00360E8D50
MAQSQGPFIGRKGQVLVGSPSHESPGLHRPEPSLHGSHPGPESSAAQAQLESPAVSAQTPSPAGLADRL